MHTGHTLNLRTLPAQVTSVVWYDACLPTPNPQLSSDAPPSCPLSQGQIRRTCRPGFHRGKKGGERPAGVPALAEGSWGSEYTYDSACVCPHSQVLVLHT